MTTRDNGGFDLFMEVSPTLATQIFAAGAAIQVPDVPFSTPAASGTARMRLVKRQASFGAQQSVGLTFDLAGSTIEVTSATGFGAVPADLQTVDLGGSVVVADRVDASALSVVIDTTPEPASGTPVITVSLDEARVLASPLVSILLAQAYILGGKAAMDNARSLLLSTIQSSLINGITDELTARPVNQTLISMPATLGGASAVPPVALSTARTLMIGVQLGGPRGNLGLVNRSALRSGIDGRDIDGLSLVISNASLLRDFIRPRVVGLLGLTPGGFVAGDPFLWFGSVTTTLPGMPPVTITSVSVSVNETQALVLTFSFSTSALAGGVTIRATVSVPITLTTTASAGGISVTLTSGPATVLSSRVDVAWWVYLLSAVSLGVAGLAALALADAIADGTVGAPITAALSSAMATTVAIPFPPGVPALTVSQQVLFQADAPRRIISLGLVSFPAAGRDHDLVLTFA